MHVMRPRDEPGMNVDPLHLTLADALMGAAETLRNTEEDLGRMWCGLWEAHKQGMARQGLTIHADLARTEFPTLNMMAQLADLGVDWTNDDYTPPGVTSDSIHDLIRQAPHQWTGGRKGVHTRLVNPIWTTSIHAVSQILGHDANRFMSSKDLFRARPEWDKPKVAKALNALRKLLDVDELGAPPAWLQLPQVDVMTSRLRSIPGWLPVPAAQRQAAHELAADALLAGNTPRYDPMAGDKRGRLYIVSL
jgi:hypothetical protein